MSTGLMFWLPSLVAAVGMLFVAALAIVRRRSPGARLVLGMSLGAAVWSGCEALLYVGLSETAMLRVTQLEYLGTTTVPLLAFLYVVRRTRPHWLTRGRVVALAVIPAATLLLAWTNGTGGLIWPRVWLDTSGPFPMLGISHGPAFYVYAVYSYALMVVALVLLAGSVRHGSRLDRRQSVVLIVAYSVPLAANLVYQVGLSPVPRLDLTPIAFTVSVAAVAWGHFRADVMGLVPVARQEVFEHIDEAIWVFDADHRLVDANPAALRVRGGTVDGLIGLDPTALRVRLGARRTRLTDSGGTDVVVSDGGESRVFDERTVPVLDPRGRDIGELLVWHDVTEPARLRDELTRLAATDPLTGAANRRAFMQQLRERLVATRQAGDPLCLVMLDLDHFKRVNDSSGHHAGDRVLVVSVERVNAVLRPGDLLGRVGGEEFAALLPGTSLVGGYRVAEALLDALRSGRVSVEPGLEIRVTASAGVAELGSDDDVDELLRRADDALLSAKRSGRDRVVAAPTAEQSTPHTSSGAGTPVSTPSAVGGR